MALTSSEEALVRQLLDQQAAILSLAGNEATITSKLGATKVTLADLVAASSLADADLLLTRQGTTDKSVRADILAAYMEAELGALFAQIANPTFTGDPKAPTAAQFDNDTSLATTAFVQRALGNMQSALSIGTNTVLNAGDVGKAILCSGSMTSLTLPDADAVPIGSFLSIYTNTVTLTISASGGDYIRLNSTNAPTSITIGNGDFIELVAIAGAWIAVSGSARLGFSDAFQRSLAASGYQKLPSGLIIQWAKNTATSSSPTFSWPIAFPNDCLAASIAQDASSSSGITWAAVNTLTATQYKLFTGTGSMPCWIIAIGY